MKRQYTWFPQATLRPISGMTLSKWLQFFASIALVASRVNDTKQIKVCDNQVGAISLI